MGSQTKSTGDHTVVSTVLENFAMLDMANNISKYVNSSKFQSILKLWARKAVPCWKHKRRNKGTAMVSQVPAAGHCGRPWAAQAQPFCISFSFLYKKEGSGHWGLALPGNSAQRQLLNNCPFPPIYTRFSATKDVQASITNSPTFKGVWDPFSQHKWVAQEDASRQAQPGKLPAPSLHALGSRPARALMLEECHST